MAWDSRARRVMMIYLPLSCFVLILLFPFYWMAITSFKRTRAIELQGTQPVLGHLADARAHQASAVRNRLSALAENTMFVAIGSTTLSLFASTLAAYAIERLRFRGSPYVGLGIYLAYLVPAVDPFHSACNRRGAVRPVRLTVGVDPACIRPSWCRSAPGC